HRVMPGERAPTEVRDTLTMSAARHEFEPLQLVIDPGAGAVDVSIEPFAHLGAEQRVWLSEVGYEQGWADRLTNLGTAGTVHASGDQASPVWINVYVPRGAPAGVHATTLTLTPAQGAAINIPVELYVFDFALPDTVGFASQLNIDVSSLIPPGGSAIDAHTLLHEHRFTPKDRKSVV